MTKQTSIDNLCLAKGMRMTEQRRVIARVIDSSDDHPDIEEIHRRAVAIDPKVSIATVYRTLRLFEDAGIVIKHDFGNNRACFESASRTHHDHIIDIESGQVIEFCDSTIEELQKKIALKHGFVLTGHKMELYGKRIQDNDKIK